MILWQVLFKNKVERCSNKKVVTLKTIKKERKRERERDKQDAVQAKGDC